jgi:2-polyprenyl-6-methoxyphenol hydroxylase-like FAD-dependent oxidoreductase
MNLVHQGERVAIDGVGFSAIGRLELLLLLQERVRSVGIEPRYNTTVRSVDELEGFDLIVAADGLNSLVRRTFEGDFKSSISYLDNKFAWYGTTKIFGALTQTFVTSQVGTFNAHHFRYSPTMSTFIIECDRATWLRAGFADMPQEDARTLCETIFSEALDGHSLVSNKSSWRNFPWLSNDRWSFRNMVLVGDALHTAHFSIGSGTLLALEDVIALVKALEDEPGNLRAGLERYETIRRPIVDKLVNASKTSAAWYEDFSDHLRLSPLDFAYSYITRSGRIDNERLRAMSPRFMAQYDAANPILAAE